MAYPTAVLTGPEERLLTALAGIEVDRNLRRDFPEELSMPGIAERLGVVRSALHNPISSLESKGLLDSIKSNVIGAPRTKTVLLITKKGLEVVSNLGLIEEQTTKFNQTTCFFWDFNSKHCFFIFSKSCTFCYKS